MSAINTKSTKAQILSAYNDLQRELELVKRQLQDALTEKGALLSQLAQEQDIPHHFQESYATLTDERNALIAENQRLVESCVAAHERCDALEAIVAAKAASQPQRQVSDSKPLPPPAVVDATPTIEVTDFDRAMWRKFQELPRETRMEIIAFARPEWGHVGIHNIAEVRAAWRAAKPVSA